VHGRKCGAECPEEAFIPGPSLNPSQRVIPAALSMPLLSSYDPEA
jgi:hypothetical protein